MKGAGQSKVCLFGGDGAVSNGIVESRKKDGTIRSAILTPATGKWKSKSKKKSSKSKTGTKGASFNQDGEAVKAGLAKKTKKYNKARKVRAKKAKAGYAAKTDGASAAPQGSGESSITAVLSKPT